MKNLTTKIIAMALIAIVGISCEKEATNTIPNATTIECKTGDRPTFTFSAGASWQLSSDQIWCKFITSGGELQEMAGGAGQHTITLKITDDNNGNQWSTAKITMKMDGKSAVIATVRRQPKELYIKLYDITDTPVKSLELGYVDYITTRIEGNFRYAAIEIPDWVEIAYKNENGQIEASNSITGIPGEQTEVLLRIQNDGEREMNPIAIEDGHTITFSDEGGEYIFEFPITFDGMGKDKLTFVGPTESYLGWEVSLDGKSFRQTDPMNNTTITFSDYLEYYITARDGEYYILYFEKSVERGIPTYTSYEESYKNFWINFDKEAMTLSVNEHTGVPRYGMVMALPVKVFTTIRASVKESVFEMDYSSGIGLESVKTDYTKYILAELTQLDFEQRGDYEGMYAYHSLTTLEIFCEPYSDTALTEKYGDVEIFKCDFVNPVENKRPGIIIDPRVENWTTATYEEGIASAEVWHGEKQLKMSEGEFYMGENTEERMAIHLWGPNDEWNGENVVVLFKVDNVVKKILVVTPPVMEI